MIEVYDRVRVINSSDSVLDGQVATVMGMYGEAIIILFDVTPTGYTPAIGVVPAILEKV